MKSIILSIFVCIIVCSGVSDAGSGVSGMMIASDDNTQAIKSGESAHFLNGQVMITVNGILKPPGAAFTVNTPHGHYNCRKKVGSRITIQVNGVAYLLDVVSVSGNSATFAITEREVNHEDDQS